MPERIQKVLARAGLGSRRTIEEWIRQGRISVNGHRAKLGDSIEPRAHICVDGRPLPKTLIQAPIRKVIAYNKPLGEVCSRQDDQDRPLVFDSLPKPAQGRWISIGRLDINTSGLILFTNDGEFANKLMHPSSQIEREYAVRVFGTVDRQMIATLLKGVDLEDGHAAFSTVTYSGGEGINQWFHVVVKEGRNRLVRRLFESQGVKVSRLVRIRYGAIILPRSLRAGRWVELENASIESLQKLCIT